MYRIVDGLDGLPRMLHQVYGLVGVWQASLGSIAACRTVDCKPIRGESKYALAVGEYGARCRMSDSTRGCCWSVDAVAAILDWEFWRIETWRPPLFAEL